MGLEIIEIHLSIEEAFDIQIQEQDRVDLLTVGKLYDYIIQKVSNSNNQLRQQEIWSTYITIVSKQLNIPIEDIQIDHHFIHDLGAG